METVVLAAVALLCLAWVLAPVVVGRRARLAVSRGDTAVGRQELRKQLILDNIADLDFEFAMGKLSDDDYRDLRESLKAQAAQFTEQIDVLGQAGEELTGAATATAAAAPARAHGAAPDAAPAAGARVATHHGNGTDGQHGHAATPRFCVECGNTLPSAARFCPSCGKQVQA